HAACTGSGGNWTCSGTDTDGLPVSGQSQIDATANAGAPGNSPTGSGKHAIKPTGDQPGGTGTTLTVNQDAGSTIEGDQDGLHAVNKKAGSTVINLQGSVVGNGGDGVYVEQQSPGLSAGLTLTTADVEGEQRGINAYQQ